MRTCTVMTYTNGTTSRYAVLRVKKNGRTLDVVEVVATYEVTQQPGERFDYRAITAKHATKQAPAVRWQA